jgi:hypothetical protein
LFRASARIFTGWKGNGAVKETGYPFNFTHFSHGNGRVLFNAQKELQENWEGHPCTFEIEHHKSAHQPKHPPASFSSLSDSSNNELNPPSSLLPPSTAGCPHINLIMAVAHEKMMGKRK